MKRTIEVRTGAITITATIDSSKRARTLTRDEVEEARDGLADDLMRAATHVRFFEVPLNRVKVSR